MLPATRQQEMLAVIDKAAPRIKEVAGSRVDMQKFTRLARAYLYQNQGLFECDPASLSVALMECATFGLYPSSSLSEAYLVPFKGKVKMIPHWAGILKLAKRGYLRDIRAYLVYKQDTFDIQYGLEEKLVHKPDFDHDFQDEDIVGCYVVKEYRDGSKSFHFMPIRKILRIRDQYSNDWRNNGKNSAWGRNFPGMILKTVIKSSLKTDDLSEDLSMLLHKDTAIEQGLEVEEPVQLPADYLTGRVEEVTASVTANVVVEEAKPEPPKKLPRKKKEEPPPGPEEPEDHGIDMSDFPI